MTTSAFPAERRLAERRRPLSSLVPLLLMVAPLLVFSAGFYWSDYEAEQRRSEELTRAVAQAADERISWAMRSLDLVLQHVADYAAAAGAADDATLATVLALQGSAMPEIGLLFLTDAEGRRRVADRPDPRFALSASRPFFAVQRKLHASQQIVIDGPVADGGRPTIVISRPILGAGGAFLGVAAAVVEPEFFTEPLRQVAPERVKSTTLFNVNGVVLSRHAEDTGGNGRPLAGTGLFAAPPAPGSSGTWRDVRQGDGSDGVGAWRALARYPLVVSAGIPHEVIMESWRSSTLRKVLPELGLLGLLTWLWALLRRRELALLTSAREFAAQLELRVEDRTRSLAHEVAERRRIEVALHEAKDAAEAASHAKSRFLAVASHDLRQPVQALNLYANVLAGRPLPDELADIVERVRRSAGSVATLLDGLLDISKLDAGIVKAAQRPIPLGELLERLWEDFCPTAEEAGVSLTVVPTRAWARTDPALLERILQNLISNAIRYTPSGGKVLVGCRQRGDQLALQVWDTGIGIPEDQSQTVFEEFIQLTTAGARRQQGLGLGLAIVRRLAGLLGHAIVLRSRVGRGSLFEIHLSAAAPALPAGCAAMAVGCVPPGAWVLVVEDEEDVLHGLALQLSDWGLRPLTASSEADALAQCRAQPVAAVIADFRLAGGGNGIALAQRLLETMERRVPVLLLTGDTEAERLRQAVASGFHLLHKPVDPDVLRRSLLGGGGSGQ